MSGKTGQAFSHVMFPQHLSNLVLYDCSRCCLSLFFHLSQCTHKHTSTQTHLTPLVLNMTSYRMTPTVGAQTCWCKALSSESLQIIKAMLEQCLWATSSLLLWPADLLIHLLFTFYGTIKFVFPIGQALTVAVSIHHVCTTCNIFSPLHVFGFPPDQSI